MGRVPYELPDDHEFKRQILTAIDEIHSKTNVRFIKREYNEADYILFICDKSQHYNSAPVGYMEGHGAHKVNIRHDIRSLHELGHVLGLEHEHQRFDRDEHIEILHDNINKDESIWKHDLEAVIASEFTNFSNLTSYDIDSCMHYWCYMYQ
jgi:hypothetical protein